MIRNLSADCSYNINHYKNGILGVKLASYYRVLFVIVGSFLIILDLLDIRDN